MFKAIRQRIRDIGTLKTLCFRAEEHANRRGHREPGAEHFVLAALELQDDTAHRALSSLGITPATFDAAIEEQYRSALANMGLEVGGMPVFDEGESVPVASGPYRAQPSGQALMAVLTREIMKAEQKRDTAAPLLGAHVLLAASAAKLGVCARALEKLGVTTSQLSDAATRALGSRAA